MSEDNWKQQKKRSPKCIKIKTPGKSSERKLLKFVRRLSARNDNYSVNFSFSFSLGEMMSEKEIFRRQQV
jgi:hypothetical protein